MKYILYGFLALPFVALASCSVVEEQYYGPGYYAPPPQVEVQRYYPDERYQRVQRHPHVGYSRHTPQPRVYHGHRPVRNNTIVVTPRAPQARVEMQRNAHGHSHSVNPGTIVRRQESGPANVKGHSPTQQSHSNNKAVTQKGHGHS